MTWNVLPASEFLGLRNEWDEIVDERYDAHPLLKFEFARQALVHLDERGSARIVVGSDGAGVHSVGLVERSRRGTWTTFGPSQVPLTLFVSRAEHWNQAAFSGLMRSLGRWTWMLSLRHFDPLYGNPLENDVASDWPKTWTTMGVETGADFETYWAFRQKAIRKKVPRYLRKAERDSLKPTIRWLRRPGDISSGVERYAALEQSGWKGRNGTAVTLDSAQGRFYMAMMKALASEECARIFCLHFGDRIIASRLCIESNGILVILKTAFDEEYSPYSPGQILLYLILRQLFEESGTRRVEFYTSATREQLWWSTDHRTIGHVNVYRSGLWRLVDRSRKSLL